MSLIGEDCHYFITAGCTRGNQCCFRHQPAARMTENPCPEWIQGKCLNPNCSLRHVPVDRYSMKRKANTPCFYENHPSGCRNPLCPFLHTKRVIAETVPLVTPIVNEREKNSVQPVPPTEPVTKPATPHVEATPHQVIIANVKPVVNASLIPPPPAPVHTLQPAIGTPTMVNGVLTIAPSRGILGATPNLARVPGVQLLPPLVTQHAGIRQTLVPQNQQSLAGTAQNNGYPGLPKTGHFNEQVRLFKEMLSAKQKNTHPNTVSNNKHYIDGSDSFSSEEDNDRRNKDKHKKRNKKEKRDRNKKRTDKEFFSKGDEEVLYGDYKDIPLDKKHKKSKSDRHNGADVKVEVKTYEQVLREKALRKMKENKKKKQKFDHDFEDILHASDGKKKSRSRKSSADDDTNIDTKSSGLKNRKESIDLDTVVFSKEDAIELDVDEDDFDIELSNDKSKNKKQKEQTKLKRRNSEKNSSTQKEKSDLNGDKNDSNDNTDKPEEVEQGVLIIPDETTDLTFSVDDTDDLALELTQEPETAHSKKKKKPPVVNKKVSSIVSCVKKPIEANSSSRHKKSNDSNRLEQKTSKNKRKILVVDSDSPVEAKKSNNELVEQAEEPKKVISLVRREEKKKTNEESSETSNKTDTIKIKTFKEIMEEKRKRKFELPSKDVVILSDTDSIDSPAKKTNELLKERSEKFKSTVLQTKNENKAVNPLKTAAMLRREKLQLAKQEYEKRRKSQQIYQVKGVQASEVSTTEENSSATSTTTTTTEKAGAIKKVKLNRPILAKESDDDDESVTVRSFEEIMNEKRLRRQLEMQQPTKITKRVDSKPIQSFLRRRSLSNQRNLQEQPTTNEVPTTAAPEPITTTCETVVPVVRVIGRRRSSSGSSAGVISAGEPKPAPIKLKRKSSTTDCKVPSISPPVSNNKSNQSRKTNDWSPESVVPSISTEKADLVDQRETDFKVLDGTNEPEASREDIQEALDENKRLREQDMLSDGEFEKEMNDLLSESDDDDEVDDVNDDDFMMELEQMIDS